MRLILTTMACWLGCFPLLAQDILTEGDQREILSRLHELEVARQTIALQQAQIAKTEELDKREADLHGKEIELWKSKLDLEQQRSAMMAEQAQFYKTAYEAASQKRGIGCTLKKIFTLGIARCH